MFSAFWSGISVFYGLCRPISKTLNVCRHMERDIGYSENLGQSFCKFLWRTSQNKMTSVPSIKQSSKIVLRMLQRRHLIYETNILFPSKATTFKSNFGLSKGSAKGLKITVFCPQCRCSPRLRPSSPLGQNKGSSLSVCFPKPCSNWKGFGV